MFMSVNVSVFVNVNEFGHWVCGESWHMPQKIFNPPPQFSRLGTLCPTLVACLFVSWDGSFLGFFLLLSVSLLVCYTHTCIIIPCIYMYMHMYVEADVLLHAHVC